MKGTTIAILFILAIVVVYASYLVIQPDTSQVTDQTVVEETERPDEESEQSVEEEEVEEEKEVTREEKKEERKERVVEKQKEEVREGSADKTSKKKKAPASTGSQEMQLLAEMNIARTTPSKYLSSRIMPYHNSIKQDGGQWYIQKESNLRLLLIEGKTATQILLDYLAKAQPRKALVYDANLEKAARDHAKDIGASGQLSHTGSGGSSISQRVSKYTTWKAVGENISYGANNPKEVIINLMVDDGVTNRGHRDNIMSTNFGRAGAHCTSHNSQYKTVCVIVYAD
ncbi:MAG: CAP domain-containing protein [Candidatus Campbellbacteria bacterium]|nr:CAP domain-containing protein [Candidatus Campbellbacteria bacterium]